MNNAAYRRMFKKYKQTLRDLTPEEECELLLLQMSSKDRHRIYQKAAFEKCKSELVKMPYIRRQGLIDSVESTLQDGAEWGKSEEEIIERFLSEKTTWHEFKQVVKNKQETNDRQETNDSN